MNKRYLIGILTILFLFLVLFLLLKNKNNSALDYKINGRNYRLLTATNQQQWEKGLMFVRKLDNTDGMIFLFPDRQYRTFWNKNTLMDLDLYWLNDDTVVGQSFLPSIEKSQQTVTVTSPEPINKVVELIRK